MPSIILVLASDGSSIGGMEKQVAIQANTLASRQSFHVQVVAHSRYASLFANGVSFHPLPMQLGRRNPLLAWRLKRTLKALDSDIIHAHGDKAASLLNRVRKGLPNSIRFATVHGTKKKASALQHMHEVIAVSQGVKAKLPIASLVIGNAIEVYSGPKKTKTDLCRRFQLDESLPLFIAAGRLAPVKRYDWLMTAFTPLPANLVVFGQGPEHQKLKALEQGHIHLAGHSDSLQSWMHAADALVISSEREGFSLSMIEALQQGLPVISTPVSGTQDLLPPSCILHASSVSELANALSEKIVHLKEIEQESANAFDRARHECHPDTIVEQLINLYHKALNSSGNSTSLNSCQT